MSHARFRILHRFLKLKLPYCGVCPKRPAQPQIDVTLARMSELDFILQGETFPVENLMGSQACDTRSHVPQRKQWFVQSDVTDDVHRLFVSAVHEKAINRVNDNVDGPSPRFSAFRFRNLLQD
jgi:hypothetical protein